MKIYELKVDKNISTAVKTADAKCIGRKFKTSEEKSAFWNKLYHNEMDRLCHVAGIRRHIRYMGDSHA